MADEFQVLKSRLTLDEEVYANLPSILEAGRRMLYLRHHPDAMLYRWLGTC